MKIEDRRYLRTKEQILEVEWTAQSSVKLHISDPHTHKKKQFPIGMS